MDKIKSIATGDAYQKPAQTKDGAFTTQDSSDAHTTEGTTADDPNVKSTSKIEGFADKRKCFECT
jgi:hypothetical protein